MIAISFALCGSTLICNSYTLNISITCKLKKKGKKTINKRNQPLRQNTVVSASVIFHKVNIKTPNCASFPSQSLSVQLHHNHLVCIS